MTSHDVVSRVRRLAGTRKVGHAGTLDPMATGVLVLGVERATRLLGHLMLTEKAYDATVRLGVATTTDDAEGEVVGNASRPLRLDEADGARCCRRVRRRAGAGAVRGLGHQGRRQARLRPGTRRRGGRARRRAAVTVHELVVHDVRLGDDVVDVDLRVRCSSGTYIRAIARDLGAALGVGGHLTALRRTAVGPYDLAVARTLDDLAEGFAVLPLAEAARAGFRAVELTDEQAADVRVGRALDLDLPGLTAVFDPAGEFLALYEPRDGRARAVAVFV